MPSGSVVSVRDLVYHYPHNGHGIDLASLSVRAGESVLITGPSGCGKSTLARCLCGLIPHLYRGQMRGKVRITGMATDQASLWQIAERVGMVFQNPALQMIASSVEGEIVFGLENLGLTRDEMRCRLDWMMDRFNMRAWRTRSPSMLSGGEQQQVALAAMAARRPPVLVLDEPLSMLDAAAAARLLGYLGDLVRDGTAVIVCEHRTEPLHELPNLRCIELSAQMAGGAGPETDRPFPAVTSDPFRLEISGLRVRLGGALVLDGLNLAAPGGQVLAVVGRNGAGKTTLLRAIAGLEGFEGSITVKGERPDFALVFQNPDLQLFNPTVRQEILFRVPRPNMDRYHWLVSSLGLARYENTPPLLLSEGQKKRVALAIALMREPRHGVLLDEPALGQDVGHKGRLIRLARTLASSGSLVVMTTHDLTLAAQADRMALLGEGRIVADGSPAELLADRAAWEKVGLFVPRWVREAI
jgi:energy-coupling factor transport system ATP-binding protein